MTTTISSYFKSATDRAAVWTKIKQQCASPAEVQRMLKQICLDQFYWESVANKLIETDIKVEGYQQRLAIADSMVESKRSEMKQLLKWGFAA